MKNSTKHRKILGIISIGILFGFNQAKAQTWTLLDSVFNSSLDAIEFYNDNTGFLSSGYLIHKTTDGGATWGAENSFWPYPIYTSFKFMDQNTILMGDDSGRIWKTTDGGTVWTEKARPVGYVKDVDIIGNNGILIDNDCYAAYTSDGGETWTALPNTLCGNLSSLKEVQMISSSVAYVGGLNGHFFKTTNGGQSWTTIAVPNSINIYGISFINDQLGYIIDGSNALFYKTTDGGANWTDLSSNIGTGNIAYDVYAVNSTLVYAGGKNGHIYKSVDGGANWTLDYSNPSATSSNLMHFSKGGSTLYGMYEGGGNYQKIAKLGLPLSGTEELTSEQFSVYPNPSETGIFNLSSEHEASATVYAVSGEKVHEFKFESGISQLNLNTLQAGTYLLKIQSASSSTVRKIIIQ